MKRHDASRIVSDDIQARQRNTVWPDTLRNGRTVDSFIWNGSPDATPVQRVGIAIFGVAFLVISLLFMFLANLTASKSGLVASLSFVLVGFAFLALAFRIFRNAFRH